MNKRKKKKLKKKQKTGLAKSNQGAKKFSTAPAASSVVACSNQNLPAPNLVKSSQPKCGPSIPVCALKDFIEVKCQHDGRKASEIEKFLEVVPSEGGDTTQLSAEMKGGCGKPPEWEISGFFTAEKKGAKTSFNAMAWHSELRWLSGVVPRTYRVRAGTFCQGMTESIEVRAYPSDKINLTFGKWASVAEKIEWVTETILSAYFTDFGWDKPSGQLTIAAGWEEYKDHRAFYGYDIALGFNPLFGLHLRIPFGPLASIPTWMKKYGDAYLFVEFKGGINVNGHWGRKSPDKRSLTVDAKGFIQGAVGASLFLMKPNVLKAEVSGGTGIEGSAETDPETEDNIRVKLKLTWQGVKGNITVKTLWGFLEVSREFKIVDEQTLLEGFHDLLGEHK